MKRLLITLLLIVPLFSLAQNNATSEAVKEIAQSTKTLASLQCAFTQKKTMKLLHSSITSKGSMLYKSPGCLRWEYTSPYSYTFILNGSKIKINKGAKSQTIDTTQNELFRSIAEIMMSSMTGSCLSNTKDFMVTATKAATGWTVTMTPVRKEIKQMFSKITLHYNKKMGVITKVVMTEKNGDNTEITLTDIKKNTNLNASNFKI